MLYFTNRFAGFSNVEVLLWRWMKEVLPKGCCRYIRSVVSLGILGEPVWPSGKALGW